MRKLAAHVHLGHRRPARIDVIPAEGALDHRKPQLCKDCDVACLCDGLQRDGLAFRPLCDLGQDVDKRAAHAPAAPARVDGDALNDGLAVADGVFRRADQFIAGDGDQMAQGQGGATEPAFARPIDSPQFRGGERDEGAVRIFVACAQLPYFAARVEDVRRRVAVGLYK